MCLSTPLPPVVTHPQHPKYKYENTNYLQQNAVRQGVGNLPPWRPHWNGNQTRRTMQKESFRYFLKTFCWCRWVTGISPTLHLGKSLCKFFMKPKRKRTFRFQTQHIGMWLKDSKAVSGFSPNMKDKVNMQDSICQPEGDMQYGVQPGRMFP